MDEITRRGALKGLILAFIVGVSVGLQSAYADDYLLHKFSRKYVCSGHTANGGKLWLWGPVPKGDEARYYFKFIPAGEDYYYLLHQFSRKYVCSGETANGGKLWLWGPIPKGDEARYKFLRTGPPNF
jgi:hypothetical protein